MAAKVRKFQEPPGERVESSEDDAIRPNVADHGHDCVVAGTPQVRESVVEGGVQLYDAGVAPPRDVACVCR